MTTNEQILDMRALDDAELDAVNGGNLIVDAARGLNAFVGLFKGNLPPQDCWVNWDGYEVCKA
jgi:hypothetical protein